MVSSCGCRFACLEPNLTRHDSSTALGGDTLRVGTSRFLPQGVFLMYKLGLVAYFLYWAIFWRAVEDYSTGPYMTHWTWYATTSYSVVSALSAFLCWRAMKEATPATGSLSQGNPASDVVPAAMTSPDRVSSAKMSSRHPVPAALRFLQTALMSVSCIGSLIVAAIFWGALYDGGDLTTVDDQAHAVIAVILLLDQFLIADEFKLRYILFAQIYGVVYLCFNIGWYYLAPKENRLIYVILDWEDNALGACIYGLGALLVGAPLFGLVHFGVFRLRERLYHQNRLARNSDTAVQPPAVELTGGTQA